MVAVVDEWRLSLWQMKGNSGGTQEVTTERQGWARQVTGGQETMGTATASDNDRSWMAAGNDSKQMMASNNTNDRGSCPQNAIFSNGH